MSTLIELLSQPRCRPEVTGVLQAPPSSIHVPSVRRSTKRPSRAPSAKQLNNSSREFAEHPAGPHAELVILASPASAARLGSPERRRGGRRANAMPAASLPRSPKLRAQGYCSRRAQWAARPPVGLLPEFPQDEPSVGVPSTSAGIDVHAAVPAALCSERSVRSEPVRRLPAPAVRRILHSPHSLAMVPLRLLEDEIRQKMAVPPPKAHLADPNPLLPKPFIAEINRQRPAAAAHWSVERSGAADVGDGSRRAPEARRTY